MDTSNLDLGGLREQIDDIDREIVERLNARVKLAAQIGKLKEQSGQEVYAPSREMEVFQKLMDLNKGPLSDESLHAIFREVISASLSMEKRITVAYLGPESTFTHQAAVKNFGTSVNYMTMGTISDVFSSVELGEVDYGVIPIENSTEGAISHSLDLLAETDLKIIAQVYLEISLCLISRSSLPDIKAVHSKDSALGQCRNWLNRMLPGVEQLESASTVKAVQLAGERPEVAAIASRIAAETHDMPIVAEGIQDSANNYTRFLTIGQSSSGRLGEGKDKSSYVFSLKDEPGALQKMLEAFSSRNLNLSKIESRPSRRKLWDYYFFVDVIGHRDDPEIVDAVIELKKNCPMVKWLGSYPNSSF